MQILQREGELKLDDVWMIQDLEGICLFIDPINGVGLDVMRDFDEFDGHFFSCHFVIGQINSSKATLAN